LSDPPAVESVEQRSCDGPNGPVSLRIYRPTGSPNERLPGLVFYHGGGWVLGSLDGVDASAGRFARRLNLLLFQ
jgi:acetyl esterase